MSNNDWFSIFRQKTIQQIAEELVSVQPMTGPVGQIFNMPMVHKQLKYQVIIDHDVKVVPENHHVVKVNDEIGDWITAQPIHMWKFIYYPETDYYYYIISDELLTWLRLKWS